MGVNNKHRRAAKKKARTRREARASSGAQWFDPPPFVPPVIGAVQVRQLLLAALDQMAAGTTTAARIAGLILASSPTFPADVARAGLRDLLADQVAAVVDGGWSPSDVTEIIRREASDALVPLAVGLVSTHTAAVPPARVAAAWLEDLRDAGPARPLRLQHAGEVQEALELAAVLVRLPRIPAVLPAPGTLGDVSHASPGDRKLLARVQALLAKAEGTEFDEEAEALSAKAQELVSRYALDRLLAQAGSSVRDERPGARRLWLDAPYVVPKATLVHAVAAANRCRSVVSDRLGFCTLVGHAADLDAVELLVPSLLVQAHAAMSRFGRQTDRAGRSRTRSFRQSFLVAYAYRIGERLAAADARAAADDPRAGELVPLLRGHRERVDAAFAKLFPATVVKETAINNAAGWAAGRAAADEALLGADLQVTAARAVS